LESPRVLGTQMAEIGRLKDSIGYLVGNMSIRCNEIRPEFQRNGIVKFVEFLNVNDRIFNVTKEYARVKREIKIDINNVDKLEEYNIIEFALILSTDLEFFKGSNDVCLFILRSIFDSNWFKARNLLVINTQWIEKENLKGKVTKNHLLELANEFLKTRKFFWGEFMKTVNPVITDAIKTRLKIANPETLYGELNNIYTASFLIDILKNDLKIQPLAQVLGAEGSESATSDIDLPMKGSNTEISVELINENFRDYFKVPFDSGMVFDINVYSLDWIHGSKVVPIGHNGNKLIVEPAFEYPEILASDSKLTLWHRNNHIIAFMKLIINLHGHEAYFENALVFHASKPQTEMINQTWTIAKANFIGFENNIKKGFNNIREKRKEKGRSFDDKNFSDRYGFTLVASNKLYAEKLKEVKATRMSIAASKPINLDLVAILAYNIGESLLYANEVYASQGATVFTVLGQMKSKLLDILKNDTNYKDLAHIKAAKELELKFNFHLLLQSATENVADALHSLNFYKDINMGYAIYRAGKYIQRLMDSVRELFNLDNAAMAIAFKEPKSKEYYGFDVLNEIATISVQAKNIEHTVTPTIKLKGVPEAILAHKVRGVPFFPTLGTTDILDKIKKSLIMFGANVINKFIQEK
jgi:hypothetical protein